MLLIRILKLFVLSIVILSCNGGNNGDADDFLNLDSSTGGPGNSAISFSPALLSFGDIGLSNSSSSSVTLSNVSDQTIFLTNVQGENSFFEIDGGDCFNGNGRLNVNDTCTVSIQFTALTGGDHEGILSFNYGTSSGSTSLTSNLTVEGSAGVNPPTNINITAVTGTSITIGWDDNSTNETSFEVNRCSGIGCAGSFVTDFTDFTVANATSYTFTGLTEGSYYRFRVRAVTGSSQSSYLEGSVAVTFGGIASVDDNGTGTTDLTSIDCRTEAQGAYVSVSWNTVADATNYFVYNVTGSGNVLLKTIAAPATSAIITGLTPNTAYNLLLTTATSTGFNSQNEAVTNITSTSYLPCIVLGKDVMSSASTQQGLQNPSSVMVYNGKFYAVDRSNHRVLIWNTLPTSNTDLPDIVLGQNDFNANYINNTPGAIGTVSAQSMYLPYSVWAGSIGGTDKLVVADGNNNRVLIWNSIPTANHQAADVSVGQANLTLNINDGGDLSRGLHTPTDVWSDGTRLFVADYSNNRALIWNTFPTTNFATPDVYLGQADGTSSASTCNSDGMKNPAGIWSDGTRVMVSQYNCHRVGIWESMPAAGTNPQPDTILGQTNLTASSNGAGDVDLRNPYRVRVFSGKIYVADYSNNRVKVWNSIPAPGSHGEASDYVIGLTNTGNGGGNQQNRLDNPMDITISGTTVFIADYDNHRITGYNTIPPADATNADFLFGQFDFGKEVLNVFEDTNNRSYDNPEKMVYDGNQFFVSDPGRHRILVYNSLPTSWNQTADYVIGQGNFTLENTGRNQAQLNTPRGICVGGGQLWVPDYGNHRVMVFDLPIVANSPSAVAVLGQTSWATATSDTGLDRTNNPIACHYDGSKFFVLDRRYDRVLVWNSLPAMAVVTDNPAADFRLGTDSNNQTSQNELYDPWGIYSDGTKLFVADSGNHRIMVWNTLTGVSDQNADFYLGGNTDFNSRNGLVSAIGLNYPTDVDGDASGRIYVLDAANGRVMMFDNPNSTNFVATEVYGKASFTDTTEPGDKSLSLSSSVRGLMKYGNRIFVSDPAHSQVLATPVKP